ncbi:MAG: N-acetylmuramoyl-L-alanine amidase [Bacillota bacterium]|nr:N-acetylmuramoyl-L-alanine amidase [Bacillota bacterium]
MKKLRFSCIISLILLIFSFIAIINTIENYHSSPSPKTITAPNSTIKTEAIMSDLNSSNSSVVVNTRKQFTIVVDAGHGGWDPGSVGPNGTKEKAINLSVALKLGRILESNNIRIIYTRRNDVVAMTNQKAELLHRAEIANKNAADLFVSIHLNYSDYKSARGTETYYYPTSTKARKLATIIQAQIAKDVKSKNRGIKAEDFSVLRNVSAPSVLVELGYISNFSEEALLRKDAYQDKLAMAIAAALLKYIKL